MALDGKLLALARKKLDDIRHHNEETQAARQREIYARLPAVRNIDLRMQNQMRELSSIALRRDSDAKAALKRLEEENLALQQRRKELLMAAGYAPNYTDDLYDCPDCMDKGYHMDGRMCACLKRLYNAEVTRDLSGLLKGDEHFGKFRLDYYSDVPDESGNIPREIMEIILTMCKNYAAKFDGRGTNLIFTGGPGLGKTFLSACIARAVSQKGYSVAYESASAALGAFEKEKFSRDMDEAAAAGAKVKRYLDCDLLILDDLGTEMNTAFTQSALYTIINQRLISGKQTIISTNLDETALAAQYSAQITSRLLGEYRWLHFLGSDIRQRRL